MLAPLLFTALVGAPPTTEALDVVPKGLEVKGKATSIVAFEDKAGRNVFVLSRRDTDGDEGRSGYLYAVHAVKAKKGWRELRRVKDWVPNCQFDLILDVKTKAFSVTDLDGDGHAEITFAYEADCTSDVSPNGLKVILLEAGAKHAVRGNTRVRVSEKDYMGGDARYDKSFDEAPKALRAHAEKVWAALTR